MHGNRPELDRRTAVLLLVVASLSAVALAVWLVPWEWVPGGELTPMRPEQLFTQVEIERAETFADQRRWLTWSSYAVSLLVAVVLGLTPVGSRLLRRAFGRLRWWLAVIGGAGAVLLVGRVVTLPLALLVRQQNVDYRLTTQSLLGWVRDQSVSFLVGWVTTALLVLVLVGCARRWPRHWYIVAGAVAALLTVAGSYLYPVLVEPLFNDFTSMREGDFRTSVLQLAQREGVDVTDVLVADASRRTTTLNAYVSGFGDTRRVVVYDTLLESLPADEALVV
ncbi:MAG: M48 family metalloprotease, partial [Nocardioidaceae bacterium]|nr:M48 family metalloprotease [Nocardioidaceae bacterium]